MTEFRMLQLTERLPVPTHLAEMAARGVAADEQWITALPGVLADAAGRWGLEIGEPYEPGGQCAWVAPVRTGDGTVLVLKVGWRHEEAEHEAEALRVWDGDGAVRLHGAFTTADASVLLLERCDPGTPLGRVLPEPEQDEVVAALLHRLWIEPSPGHPFRPLQTMCDQWADEFEEKLARRREPVDTGLSRDGVRALRELSATAPRNVLVCTDLHPENVLAAEREAWLVVDPKPYVGDPAYDATQHMLNCMDRLVDDPRSLSRRMAGLLDVEEERVRAWLFARCVQESIGDDGRIRASLLDIARAVAP